MTADSSDWTFFSAPLAPDRAEGRTEADGSLSIRLPSRRACAWWERKIAVSSRGVRFRAEARVALGPDETVLFNDLAMLVTWYDPAHGARKGLSDTALRTADSENTMSIGTA